MDGIAGIAAKGATGEGFRVIFLAEVEHDPLLVAEYFGLETATIQDVIKASLQIREATQKNLVAHGMPPEFTVYRAGALDEPVISVHLDEPPVEEKATPYSLRRQDVLCWVDPLTPGTFATNEMLVYPDALRPGVTAAHSDEQPDYGAEEAPRPGPIAYIPGAYTVEVWDADQGHLLDRVTVDLDRSTIHDDLIDMVLSEFTVAEQDRAVIRNIERVGTVEPWDAKTASRIADARGVGAALRRAGFPASRSSGSRVRGAPRVTPGYKAERHNPLGTTDWVVKVYWEGDWQGRGEDEKQKVSEMAEALAAAGYVVERPTNTTLYVWEESIYANKVATKPSEVSAGDSISYTLPGKRKPRIFHVERVQSRKDFSGEPIYTLFGRWHGDSMTTNLTLREDEEVTPMGRHAAADHQYYHGTAHPFRPGDVVVPASQLGEGTNYQPGVGSTDHVYLSDDLAQAYFFAVLAAGVRGLGRAYVFAVEPENVQGSQAYEGQEILADRAEILTDVTDRAEEAFDEERDYWIAAIKEMVPASSAHRFLKLLEDEPEATEGAWAREIHYDEYGEAHYEWNLADALDIGEGTQVVIEQADPQDDYYWVVYIDGTEAAFGVEEDLEVAQRKAELAWNQHKTSRTASYDRVTEEVPTAWVAQFREFTREPGTERYEALRADIAQNGIQEPLLLEVSVQDNKALLTEGNHRLRIAEELGLSTVPVRVLTRRRLDRGVPVQVREGVGDGWDLKPSEALEKTAIAKQVWYRATNDISGLMEDETFVHVGTAKAAAEARDLGLVSGGESANTLYRIDVQPKNPYPQVLTDDLANEVGEWDYYRQKGKVAPWVQGIAEEDDIHGDGLYSSHEEYEQRTRSYLRNSGVDPDAIEAITEYDAIYYENDFEDVGSKSAMVRPSAVVSVEEVGWWEPDKGDWEFIAKTADIIENPYFSGMRESEVVALIDIWWETVQDRVGWDENLYGDDRHEEELEMEERMIRELPEEELPLKDIIPAQSFLNTEKLDAGAGWSDDPLPPMVIRSEGRNVLKDGHHRYYLARQRGDETMKVRVFDADRAMGRTAARLTPEQETALAEIRDEARAAYCSPGSLGGCFPAAEAVESEFGWEYQEGHYMGAMAGDPDDTHAWNRMPDGTIVDVTAAQFGEGHDVRIIEPGDPDYEKYVTLRTASIDETREQIYAQTGRIRDDWGVGEEFLSENAATQYAWRVLQREVPGFPTGQFNVTFGREPGGSAIWDPIGGDESWGLVSLGEDSRNELVLLHELAHIIIQYGDEMEDTVTHPPHGPEFERVMTDLYERYLELDWGKYASLPKHRIHRALAPKDELPPGVLARVEEIREEAHADLHERSTTIGPDEHDWYCMTQCNEVSWALFKEFGWKQMEGNYIGHDRNLEGALEAEFEGSPDNMEYTHFWNVMPDGTWVDATADQFRDRAVRVMPPGDPRREQYATLDDNWRWVGGEPPKRHAAEVVQVQGPLIFCPECQALVRGTDCSKCKTAGRVEGPWYVTDDGRRLWGPHGAAGLLAVYRGEGEPKYLLQRRSAGVEEGGTWGIPGGALDEGEDPRTAARREFEEEVGADSSGLRLVDIWVDQVDPGWSYTTVVAEVDEMFDVGEDSSWETEGHGWFTKAEMTGLNLHPGFAQALPKLADFVDYKPERSLSDPTKTTRIDSLIPVEVVPYDDVPFIDEMHAAMGASSDTPIKEYMDRRKAFFDRQPVRDVPVDGLIVTQEVINTARVEEIVADPATGGTQPLQIVSHGGDYYLMNGHHRVAAEIMNGNDYIRGAVWEADAMEKAAGIHADERVQERLTDAGLKQRDIDKVYHVINALTRVIRGDTAVRILKLPKQVNEAWGDRSNGNEVWAIYRDGDVKTVMLRRDTQPATPEALRVDSVQYIQPTVFQQELVPASRLASALSDEETGEYQAHKAKVPHGHIPGTDEHYPYDKPEYDRSRWGEDYLEEKNASSDDIWWDGPVQDRGDNEDILWT